MPTRRAKAQDQFDPHSINATLATIIANQQSHSEEMRGCFEVAKQERAIIREQVLKTNGRVGALEVWREATKAKVAGIAFAVGTAASLLVWAFEAWKSIPR